MDTATGLSPLCNCAAPTSQPLEGASAAADEPRVTQKPNDIPSNDGSITTDKTPTDKVDWAKQHIMNQIWSNMDETTKSKLTAIAVKDRMQQVMEEDAARLRKAARERYCNELEQNIKTPEEEKKTLPKHSGAVVV